MTKKREKLSFVVPTYIVKAIKILESIHPALATRFALFIFYRPLPFPLPARERDTQASAEKLQMRTAEGAKFTSYRWAGSRQKAKVLLVHGWSGRGTQFFALIEKLRSLGVQVFAIDAPAHGIQKEKKTDMLQFVDAVEVMYQKHGPFDLVVGHSLGGMALFNALNRHADLSPKFVTIGSPASVENVVYDFCDKVGASPKVAKRICQQIEKRFRLDIAEVGTAHLAQKLQPLGLVLHDNDDRDVPVENAHQIAEAWPNAQKYISDGLGHRRILSDESMLDRIVNLLQA